jgi:hypothetical protein
MGAYLVISIHKRILTALQNFYTSNEIFALIGTPTWTRPTTKLITDPSILSSLLATAMVSHRSSKELKNGSSEPASVEVFEAESRTARLRIADDSLLARLGYKAEFRREFSASFTFVSPYSNDSHLLFSLSKL